MFCCAVLCYAFECLNCHTSLLDLHLGDAHIVPVDDIISRTEGADVVSSGRPMSPALCLLYNEEVSLFVCVQMALIVAQCREGGRLSGIKLSALSSGLQRVVRLARKKKGLPYFTQLYT